MIKQIERLGDRLLGVVVPKVSASADPCTCSGSGTQTTKCFCNAGAGSFGTWVKTDWKCNGCQWVVTRYCYDTWDGCVR